MNKLNLVGVVCGLVLANTVIAQIPENKATKRFEYHESLTVERAGDNDVINRLYKWGNEYFKDEKFKAERDDKTFKTASFKVNKSMVENHFGVNHVHTKRILSFDLKFEAEKKDYQYSLTNMKYECVEADRKGIESTISVNLEEYKGPAKRSLYEEIDLVCKQIIEEMQYGAEEEMSDEDAAKAKEWLDQKEAENKAAEAAATQAEKEAAAAAKAAEKEVETAAKAAEKEASDAEKKAEAEAKEAEKQAAAEAKAAAAEAKAAAAEEAKQAAADAKKAAADAKTAEAEAKAAEAAKKAAEAKELELKEAEEPEKK